MKLIGKETQHIKFGNGIITGVDGHMFTVDFSGALKKFIYPDAFFQFMSMTDQKEQDHLNKILKEVIKEEQTKKEEEQEEQERQQRIRSAKILQNSQAAFGLRENSEEEVFQLWSVSTGSYMSGPTKGQPRVPTRLRLNSSCLLTKLPSSVPEAKRRIIGLFMVKDDFDGIACTDGMIPAHECYRLNLDEEEQLLYYDFVTSEAETLRWGNSEMRYLSNDTVKMILEHLAKTIQNPEKEQLAKKMYQYFCFVNRFITEEEYVENIREIQ